MMDTNEITMIGHGREAIDLIVDKDSLLENNIAGIKFDPDYGPGAVIGTAKLQGQAATVIANDAMAFNERFPVVFGGVIGLEEAYKMATAVYETMAADQAKPLLQKRPIVLIVDTPGNGPGKLEELAGMNKATGCYQLALAEARKAGHPVLAVVIGRAISGAFVCHGLHADQILALSQDYGTMIHVMPITSISRITKMDIEKLEKLSTTNPVFAAGADFFYKLGGVEAIINAVEDMRVMVLKHIKIIYDLKSKGEYEKLGPMGRGLLGAERGGRTHRLETIRRMDAEYDKLADGFINA